MAAIDVRARKVPPTHTDDLDDLFDYDFNTDLFCDVDTNMDVPAKQAVNTSPEGILHGRDLGIQEEIKVSKRRAPIAKLDESRLLSPAGIPKLRRIAKDRLRFKGKGHEYSDIARLLNVYQLWLDDLYPRAKFADGLAIIEKLGHTKRMQIMRKEWINGSKPREYVHDAGDKAENGFEKQSKATDLLKRPQTLLVEDNDGLYTATHRVLQREQSPKRLAAASESLSVSDNEEENDLDALLAEDGSWELAGGIGERLEDNRSGDDLHALLAEDEQRKGQIGDGVPYHDRKMNAAKDGSKNSSDRFHPDPEDSWQRQEENYNDEMEAMAGLDGMW